jgi:hypothetical protein
MYHPRVQNKSLRRFDNPISNLRYAMRTWGLTKAQQSAYVSIYMEDFDNALNLVLEGNGIVAKKAKTQSMFSTKFAAITLSKDEKAVAKSWVDMHIADCETYWVNLGVNGWKQSSTYDSENDCWIVSMTQRDETHMNYDVCVTSRADNPIEALMLTIYKVEVLYCGVKLPTERETENWG